MTNGIVAPQAYTKETLAQAFNWLQSQPESIKNLAQEPDTLIGLYLRAKRGGMPSLETEAPVSSENFKNNLKTLAGELKQFVEPEKIEKKVAHPTHMTAHTTALDPRTQQTLQLVRQQLNLSSESEALRMLVVLGYEKLQLIYK